ncbi:MAG: peptidase S8 [Ancylobacter novellus]|uniref:Peptidase S8 n=1 Tax=Ancylobacter novellus TaxID=921 RepID=A0A2W5KL95_ANCNO|nr:MAG: peptidase S8 [Ancylobacter novellus]
MKTPDSSRRPSRLRLLASVAFAAALAVAVVAAPLPAFAQTTDNPTRGGHGRGGGKGIGAGIIGAAIGIGAILLIEGARAHKERPRVVEETDGEVERPRRERKPQAEKPKIEKPRTVRVRAEPAGERPTARTERRKAEKVARRTPSGKGPGTPGGAGAIAPAVIPTLPALAASDVAIVPGEVLCELRAGLSDADTTGIARDHRLERISIERFALTGTTIVRYRIRGDRPPAEVATELAADPRVATAQPNHVFSLSEAKLAATQYAVDKMRLKEAHGLATGVGVTVAIIDSGVDARHPSLKGAVIESFDPVGGTFRPHAHGTAVAALAAGRGDLDSPAPAARVLAIRAFAPDQPAKPGAQGTTMHILRGLDFAASRGAKVVNMSFAGPRDAKIAEFMAAGAAKGAIYVAAAGNAGPASPPLYPAAEPGVIAVTATGADDALLAVANRGPHLSVAAPGVDVLVAAPGGGYAYMSGTSMASAEVAGVVALLAEAKPGLTASEAKAALESSARDLGAAGPDPDFGAGATDAQGALGAVGRRGPSADTPTPAPAAQSGGAAVAERP